MDTELACDLTAKTCKPCEGGVPPMEQAEVERMLEALNEWEQVGMEIAKTFRFKNYYETMAFVNSTAWISHREDHHPDLEVGYNQCRVRYSTHAIGGLSENDFICAAKIDNLLKL
ncbi:putative pterin-4-alpha-carbinolamine dehydratase [Sulfurimicrobium lacus]|uniref:Putative pterin-4-alpha-carbinolamine dehydratase n=1 Tax=Sulfurimicrobium lacus TaxID=2715678 RepID=A0A6F8VEU9_9PROT|nr:4a-hydroxytetrahydrobiopterin dehydratase [Sulfurimicrobium lacus]BCB27472.1 putative pterin-4-alpha-carbinolamine dehydratase [Sulfurimicrobium lacus]